jgi:hypothetical protein
MRSRTPRSLASSSPSVGFAAISVTRRNSRWTIHQLSASAPAGRRRPIYPTARSETPIRTSAPPSAAGARWCSGPCPGAPRSSYCRRRFPTQSPCWPDRSSRTPTAAARQRTRPRLDERRGRTTGHACPGLDPHRRAGVALLLGRRGQAALYLSRGRRAAPLGIDRRRSRASGRGARGGRPALSSLRLGR